MRSRNAFFQPLLVQLAIATRIKESCPGIAYVSARRVGDNQIPFAINLVCFSVHCGKLAISVQQRQNISLYVPLWMSPAALLDVTEICFMPQRPERLANLLRFFAGNKHSHGHQKGSPSSGSESSSSEEMVWRSGLSPSNGGRSAARSGEMK